MDTEPQPGGGWISGPSTDAPTPRPEYNPNALVLDVAELLRAKGIDTVLDPVTAQAAAADLLRAFGVTPATAPRRR